MEGTKEGSNGKIEGNNVNASKVRGIFPVLWIRSLVDLFLLFVWIFLVFCKL
jgi:hypothetical protein